MAAPPKPWERKPDYCRGLQVDQSNLSHVNQRSTTGLSSIGSRSFQSPAVQRAPPPLPTRPSQQTSLAGGGLASQYGYSGYGGRGLGYGSYGGGMYGGYGAMYPSFGGSAYGGGLGYGAQRFGAGGDEPFSRFVRQAEESSRPAFQSIESIVQAFASVSMMLESTFHTVYNSFRAVLGVAEHFSRLKLHLARIFSAVALFRLLRYLHRKLLVLLGLRTAGFAEEVWQEVESQASEGALAALPASKQKRAPSWPIFMFFAVVVGGPYIIWKLLSFSEEETEASPEWASGEEDHVVARAEYDFDGDGEKELSFHSGDFLNVAPKDLQPRVRGWLLASSGSGDKIGLVPANYVKILGKRRGRKHGQNGPGDAPGLPMPSSGAVSASGQHQPALSTSHSVPADLATASRDPSVDFARAFDAPSDSPQDRFVAGEMLGEEQTDFILNAENASDGRYAGDKQDFAEFESNFMSRSGTENRTNDPPGKS